MFNWWQQKQQVSENQPQEKKRTSRYNQFLTDARHPDNKKGLQWEWGKTRMCIGNILYIDYDIPCGATQKLGLRFWAHDWNSIVFASIQGTPNSDDGFDPKWGSTRIGLDGFTAEHTAPYQLHRLVDIAIWMIYHYETPLEGPITIRKIRGSDGDSIAYVFVGEQNAGRLWAWQWLPAEAHYTIIRLLDFIWAEVRKYEQE